MADDAGELDEVRNGRHWWVVGRSEKQFATKGEAIAEAWRMTPAGGTRPDVKSSSDLAAQTRVDDQRVEVRVTPDAWGEEEDIITMDGRIVGVTKHASRTATIEMVMRIDVGEYRDDIRTRAEKRLALEADRRGLVLGGTTQFEIVFTGRSVGGAEIRATARALMK
jgi:hypothetical protein